VEHDVVLSYEVYHAGLRVFPVLLPVRCQLPGCRDVSDGGIEPDIQHFTLSALDGYGHAPVEVTADGPGLKSLVEPRLALSVNVSFPFGVFLEDPLPDPGLVLVKRKVPVECVTHHRGAAADGRFRVNKVSGAERCSALLALVAIGVLIAAVRAGAGDIPVSQEATGLLVIILAGGFLNEFPLVIQLAEKLRGGFVVNPVRCT